MTPLRQQQWPDGTLPVVSIFNWTYNHSSFIRESIESILDQETDFPVEIIIHDDASTDGTAEIVNEYSKSYPQLFRNVVHSQNQYSQGICLLKPLLIYPRGKYIALSHGDDFWTDKNKLKRQIDLLEKNSHIVLVGHRFHLASESCSNTGNLSQSEKEIGNLEDILLRNYVHTATGVFRNGLLTEHSLANAPDAGDWFLWSQLAKHGKIAFINDVMSAYRVHLGGVASGLPIRKKLISVRKSINRIHQDFGKRYLATKRSSLSDYELQCALQACSSDLIFSIKLLLTAFLRTPSFVYRHHITRKLRQHIFNHLSSAINLRHLARSIINRARNLGSIIKRRFFVRQ